MAAFEEGRYDKTMAIEEDSGWKNRIAFPSKKKEKEVQAESEDASAYKRPVERELRAPVEPKAATAARNGKAETGKSEEERFDLGALAAAGLPKDVTPEEIAALAAAAARVKERLVQEEKAAQPTAEMAVVRPEVSDQDVPDQRAEIKPEAQAAPAMEVAAAAVPEQKAPAHSETSSEASVPATANVAPEAAELKPEAVKVETASPETEHGGIPPKRTRMNL